MDLTFCLKKIPEQEKKLTVAYFANFLDPRIKEAKLSPDESELQVKFEKDQELLKSKVEELIEKYASMPEFKEKIFESFEGRNLQSPSENRFEELLKEGYLVQSSPGFVNLGHTLSLLKEKLDHLFFQIAATMDSKIHSYPSMLPISFMKRANYFNSFPHHVFFVHHLPNQIDTIQEISKILSKSDNLHSDRMTMESCFDSLGDHTVSGNRMMSPTVCYHTFRHFEDQEVEFSKDQGITITALNSCFRNEGKTAQSLSRLLEFHMREIVFIGHPDWVGEQKNKVTDLTCDLVKKLGLKGELANANDPFFTSSYDVKAFHQRNKEMKLELRLDIPSEKKKVAVASFNYHSSTFGKNFGIHFPNKKPACSGCIGFGLERWLYAVVDQFGLEKKNWPEILQ